MQRKPLLGLVLGAGAFLVCAPSAHATRLVYYNFNTFSQGTIADGTAVPNGGSLGTAGTFNLGGGAGNTATVVASGAPGPSGNALQLTPGNDGFEGANAPNVNTAFTAAGLSITPTTAYTAMAWVNFANGNGDNMLFGGDGSPVLHLGSRNGNLHSGHWGDDLSGGGNGAGTWHHVAYTNDAAGTQSIYFDGALVITGPGDGGTATGGGMDTSKVVLIGTSANGGSFNGQLDEVKIFDQTLSAAQIQTEMVVQAPEPATMGVLALAAVAAGMVRRRREAR